MLFLMHEVIQTSIITILENNYCYWHGICNFFYPSMALLLRHFGVMVRIIVISSFLHSLTIPGPFPARALCWNWVSMGGDWWGPGPRLDEGREWEKHSSPNTTANPHPYRCLMCRDCVSGCALRCSRTPFCSSPAFHY